MRRSALAILLSTAMLNGACASTGSLGGDVLLAAGAGAVLIMGAGAAAVAAAGGGVDDAADVNDEPLECLEPALDAFKTAETYEQVADCYERQDDAENAERMRALAAKARRNRSPAVTTP